MTFFGLLPPVGVAVVLALGAFVLGEVSGFIDAAGTTPVRVAGVATKTWIRMWDFEVQ